MDAFRIGDARDVRKRKSQKDARKGIAYEPSCDNRSGTPEADHEVGNRERTD